MQYDIIKPLIDNFNNLIDSLIKDLEEFKLHEEAVAFLAKRTRNFINSTQSTFLDIIFKVLEKTNDTNYNFDDEINISKEIIKKIFEDINSALNNILAHEEEEHDHDHDHGHEHHHHVDVENVQDDLNLIREKLVILKEIIGDICNIIVLSLKYHNNTIDESKFNTEYNTFKEKVKSYKDEF
jgi:ABC-type nickel/cobalt efflux system permease component RcnA